MKTASPAHPSNSAENPTGPGRPTGHSPEAVAMLCSVIRQTGISDSAAAERLGIGVSTLSRWKRVHPEVRIALARAREECRELILERVLKASQMEDGRGWRAAAWLLERIFPGDYARSAADRGWSQAMEERRREKEVRAELRESSEQEREPENEQTEEQPPDAEEPSDPTTDGSDSDAESCETPVSSSVSDCRNYRNPAPPLTVFRVPAPENSPDSDTIPETASA